MLENLYLLYHNLYKGDKYMKNNNSKIKKLLLILLSIIVILFAILAFCYYNYFYPKFETKSIDSEITLSSTNIALKFIPKDLKFSPNEISAQSQAEFTEEELTDIFIAAINEVPEAKEYLNGLSVEISDDGMTIYINGKYHNIPIGGKLTFTAYSNDGKGVFHYEEGKIGFFNIPKETLFNNLEDNLFFQFDKDNDDIILSFPSLNQIQVTNIETKDNVLKIDFKGLLTLKK